ncbi:MAG: hypothetical protein KDC38_05315, partial [Planctomycetes bacterium]|nr:hypothetical protein [Planctomycetota bacterium]
VEAFLRLDESKGGYIEALVAAGDFIRFDRLEDARSHASGERTLKVERLDDGGYAVCDLSGLASDPKYRHWQRTFDSASELLAGTGFNFFALPYPD